MKSSVKGFIVGAAIGLVALPVSVSAAQKVFDISAEVSSDYPTYLQRFDDPDFRVKCWATSRWSDSGISCLPWDEVKER